MRNTESYIHLQDYSTPCGKLLLGEVGGHLCLSYWAESSLCQRVLRRLEDHFKREFRESTSNVPVLQQAKEQLDAYFAGHLQGFDIPLLAVGTDFQQRIWQGLTRVPFGTTSTYQALARQCQVPQAVRAVANALAVNPLQIILPCHRIVREKGALSGYAGGVAAKRFLLSREAEVRNGETQYFSW